MKLSTYAEYGVVRWVWAAGEKVDIAACLTYLVGWCFQPRHPTSCWALLVSVAIYHSFSPRTLTSVEYGHSS